MVAGTAAGTPSDAVNGIVPRYVVEPENPEAVAETLAWASRDRLTVLTRGAGTKSNWGSTPRSIDILLSTRKLSEVVAHRYGDLTATIQAGAPLAKVNAQLATHRQWIPLDPPWSDRATIGGLVATNDSGPRRHRYGAPRDLIIGAEFARADGTLAKGGGIVVKNVAGYDLPRLMTGSFGTLAVIVTATFKLFPLTTASKTVIVDLKEPRDIGALTQKVLASHLTPTAIELETPRPRLLIRFESIAEAVEQQAATAAALIRENGFVARATSGSEEDRLWADHGQAFWDADGAIIKIAALPSDVPEVLSLLDSTAGAGRYAATGRAGLGVLLARVTGDPDAQARVIAALRAAIPQGRGSVVIVRGSGDLKASTDVWGPIGDALPLMRAVKTQFDPAGILNPGRGPGG